MSGDFPAANRRPNANSDRDPVACGRCAGPVELLTVLPRNGDHPAFRIFACPACTFVQWIAVTVAE
jgi:hypothetical protein